MNSWTHFAAIGSDGNHPWGRCIISGPSIAEQTQQCCSHTRPSQVIPLFSFFLSFSFFSFPSFFPVIQADTTPNPL